MAEATTGRAELLTRRTLAVGAGAAALVAVLAAQPLSAYRGDGSFDMREIALSVPLILAASAGTVAPWVRVPALRGLAFAVTAVWLGALVVALPLSAAQTAPVMPWIVTAAGAVVVPAILAGGQRYAWIVIATSFGLTLVHRILLGDFTLAGWANDLAVLVTSTVIAYICTLLIELAVHADAVAERRAAAGAEASATRGRLMARRRASGVVHDDVLATLTLAAADGMVPRERLAAQARRAADAIAALAAEPAIRPAQPLEAALAELVSDTAPEATFAVVGTARDVVPDTVRAAFVGATREALTNSLRHAGEGATLSVALELRADAVSVVVGDDGRGFDPAAVPFDRLGVRESIRRRMADAGGAATVLSADGEGTRVLLEWAYPVPGHSADDVTEPGGGTAGFAVVTVVFTASQVFLATLSALHAGAVPLVVCAVLLAACEMLRRAPTWVPSAGRTALIVGLVLASQFVGLLAAPYSFGDTWFATAAAFALAALALRGRPTVALIAMVASAALLVAAGALAGATVATILTVLARPVLLVLFALGIAVAVVQMQKRTRTLYQRTSDSIERAAWDAAARAELVTRAAQLARTVGPILGVIASGRALSATERRQCLALEGALRDDLRAGRLGHPSLVRAAAKARARGVDVLLLDDAHDDPADLDTVAEWMAQCIETAQTRAVGRLLPAGRGSSASVVVDGRRVVLPCGDSPEPPEPVAVPN